MQPGDLVTVYVEPFDDEAWAALRHLVARALVVTTVDADFATVQPRESRFCSVVAPCRVALRNLESLSPEVVPRRNNDGRAVVYLDQCVVSQLVKHGEGRLSGENAKACEQLLDALDVAIFEKGTAICVESTFHQLESSELATTEAGQRLFEAHHRFFALRSRRLFLHSHLELLRGQACQRVAVDSMGCCLPTNQLWSLGLSRDPNEPNHALEVLPGMVLTVPWNPVRGELPRVAATLEQERAAGQYGSFEKMLEICQAHWRREALENHGITPWNIYWRDSRDEIDPVEISNFLQSPAFFELPYVYCGSRLSASLLSEPKRHFRDGDYVDLRFAARGLPYCDLMMLDGDLANRVKCLKLDQRFGTCVLSARLDDYALAAQWLRSRSTT